MSRKCPLMVDLFCGLGGWAQGGLAEGYDLVGFDIEQHVYGEHRYPGQLVIQNVLTLHGSQFRDAALIVASPPCQFFSYCAMPWSRAKALAAKVRADPVLLEEKLALFNACFRIQREACAAAGRHIPMVVENVKGAQPWVGRARWSFGSYYLWADVPALMPAAIKARKPYPRSHEPHAGKCAPGSWFPISHDVDGRKNPGFRFDGSGRSFQSESVDRHAKAPGGAHIRDGAAHAARLTNPAEGRKGAGAGAEWFDQNLCQLPSASPRRKAASAMIAKIPEPLARHIARTFLPGGYGVGNSAA